MHDNADQAALEATVEKQFEIMVKLVIRELRLQWHDACAWVEVAIKNAWATFARGTRTEAADNWCTYLVQSAIRMARRQLARDAKREAMRSLEGLIERDGSIRKRPGQSIGNAGSRSSIGCARPSRRSRPVSGA